MLLQTGNLWTFMPVAQQVHQNNKLNGWFSHNICMLRTQLLGCTGYDIHIGKWEDV